MIWWLVFGSAVVVALLAAHSSWTAGRIDRLHHRVIAARAAVEAELARRTALVIEVASSGLLDPASSLLLLDAAHRARTATADDREQCESALTRALGATVAATAPTVTAGAGAVAGRDLRLVPWAGELADSARRLQMARRFHNDVVTSTRSLRRRRLVTWLRLAGRAPMPRTIELDDGG